MSTETRPAEEASRTAATAAADAAQRDAESAPVQAGSQSLLPPPTGDSETDAVAILCTLMSRNRELQAARGAAAVKEAQKLRDEEWKKVRAAIKKAIEASKKGGFWRKVGGVLGKVAKVTAVVAAVAAAVATCGAATPIAALAIAGAVLSTAAAAQSEWHYLEELGMDAETAGWVQLSMAVAGAAGTGAAAFAGTGAGTLQVAQRVAIGVNGSAQAAHGGATIETARYAAQAEDHRADAAEHRLEIDVTDRELHWALQMIEEADRSDQRAAEVLAGVSETKNETLLVSARA